MATALRLEQSQGRKRPSAPHSVGECLPEGQVSDGSAAGVRAPMWGQQCLLGMSHVHAVPQ